MHFKLSLAPSKRKQDGTQWSGDKGRLQWEGIGRLKHHRTLGGESLQGSGSQADWERGTYLGSSKGGEQMSPWPFLAQRRGNLNRAEEPFLICPLQWTLKMWQQVTWTQGKEQCKSWAITTWLILWLLLFSVMIFAALSFWNSGCNKGVTVKWRNWDLKQSTMCGLFRFLFKETVRKKKRKKRLGH